MYVNYSTDLHLLLRHPVRNTGNVYCKMYIVHYNVHNKIGYYTFSTKLYIGYQLNFPPIIKLNVTNLVILTRKKYHYNYTK